MAPNLGPAQHENLRDRILHSSLSDDQIAQKVKRSSRTVRAARSNLRWFGSTKAPSNGGGRQSDVTPPMRTALRDHLKHPGSYIDDLATLQWYSFEEVVSKHSIRTALEKMDWSKKTTRCVA